MTTVKSALVAATGMLAASSQSPALDAEVLLCHVLDKPRSFLRAWPEQKLTANQQQAFQAFLGRRNDGIPIAYLTGKREFWSREFVVTPDVLIPRPDTECLIEQCLALLAPDRAYAIADLGTGSGIIAITLAAERPLAHIVACDASPAALAVAQTNAERHGLSTIRFYQSDWFAALPQQPFDCIVSNPPYIAEADPHLSQGDVRFEPEAALVATGHGLDAIKAIVDQARCWLSAKGYLLVEHGYDQGHAVQGIFRAFGYQQVITHTDLGGQDRVTSGRYDKDCPV